MSKPKVPAPPPGFTLIEDDAPPPPPGFTLIEDDAQAIPPAPAGPIGLPTGSDGTFGPASKSGAALRGFGQGASFGFSDELSGAVSGLAAGFSRVGLNALKTAPGRALMRAYLGDSVAGMPDAAIDAIIEQGGDEGARQVLGMKPRVEGGAGLPEDKDAALKAGYLAGRDNARLEQVQAQKAHPVITGAANLAGGVAAPAPGIKGLVGLARAGSLAKTGAAMGAAAGLGYSNADLTGEGGGLEATGDVAVNAAAGGVLAPALGILGDKMGPYLRRLSQENALKAFGTRAGIDNVLGKLGYESADDARELGQWALDRELIKPFGKAEGVMERAKFGKDLSNSRAEAVLSDADKAGVARQGAMTRQFTSSIGKGPATPDVPPIFDAPAASWQAVGEVLGPEGLNPTAIRAGARARQLVSDIANLPNTQEPTFMNANQMKRDMYDGINWATDTNLQTRMQRDAVRGLRKSIEDQVGGLLGPEATDELRSANQAFGKYADIHSLAKDEATRQLGRKTLTALDIGTAVSAGGVGGAGGAMTVLGSKLLGSRIPSAMAIGQQALSTPRGEFLAPVGRNLLDATINLATKPATSPVRPGLSEEEETAVQAFLSGN